MGILINSNLPAGENAIFQDGLVLISVCFR
jgi:hypothetical protein